MPAPPDLVTSDSPRAARLGLARLAVCPAPLAETGLRALALADQVAPADLARCALYGRRAGARSAPALLFGLLERADPALADALFARVIDDGPTLRAWVGHHLGGATGRRSLGSASKRRARGWLAARSEAALLRASAGARPSLADVVRLVHPRPRSARRRAFYGWLLKRPHQADDLPPLARALDAWRNAPEGDPPQVPLRLLTSAPLDAAAWTRVARRASWQELRQHLNAFARRGLLADPDLVAALARTLADPVRIGEAGAQPHQVLAAQAALRPEVPAPLRAALARALELSLAAVPPLPGRVAVRIEDGPTLREPLTGTSASRRADLADAVADLLVRRNPTAQVARTVDGAALRASAQDADLVVVLAARSPVRADLRAWDAARGDEAKLAWIALAADPTPPAPARPDVLDMAGFGGAAFATLARFATGLCGPDPWWGEVADSVLLGPRILPSRDDSERGCSSRFS